VQLLSRARAKHDSLVVLAVLLAVSVAVVLLINPHEGWPAQDPGYHDFADGRTLVGVPNFWNVISNLPFLLIGFVGIRLCLEKKPGYRSPWLEPWERTAFAIVFLGVALTCFGSAYYHLRPANSTLFWDRLPMTLGFMGLLAIIIGERAHAPWGKAALWPLVFAGAFSVVYWYMSELGGSGDLRPYVLVQFYPLLLIPVLLLFPPRYSHTASYLVVLGWYLLAKVFEALDFHLFDLTSGGMSGHSLKHVAAAAGAYWLYRMLICRQPVETA
jgi:hypothetical protein